MKYWVHYFNGVCGVTRFVTRIGRTFFIWDVYDGDEEEISIYYGNDTKVALCYMNETNECTQEIENYIMKGCAK